MYDQNYLIYGLMCESVQECQGKNIKQTFNNVCSLRDAATEIGCKLWWNIQRFLIGPVKVFHWDFMWQSIQSRPAQWHFQQLALKRWTSPRAQFKDHWSSGHGEIMDYFHVGTGLIQDNAQRKPVRLQKTQRKLRWRFTLPHFSELLSFGKSDFVLVCHIQSQ